MRRTAGNLARRVSSVKFDEPRLPGLGHGTAITATKTTRSLSLKVNREDWRAHCQTKAANGAGTRQFNGTMRLRTRMSPAHHPLSTFHDAQPLPALQRATVRNTPTCRLRSTVGITSTSLRARGTYSHDLHSSLQPPGWAPSQLDTYALRP
jgi:hypothetical protein